MTRQKSPMAIYERYSPNRTAPRNAKIRGSTPHHVVGNLSIEAILGLPRVITYDPVGGMSMNYAIGSDGRIGVGVAEKDRAWTSSSTINDNRCITTEIANCSAGPDWRMSDEAINAWLNLTIEQCRFYGFSKVNYQIKPAHISRNTVDAWINTWAQDDEWIITLHNWFSATECPGPYFTRQLPWLVREMNKRLQDGFHIPESFVGENSLAIGPIIAPDGTSEASDKTIEAVALEVVAGAWGENPERDAKLQLLGFDPVEIYAVIDRHLATVSGFQPYEIRITVPALNVRFGPGVDHRIVRTLVNDPHVYTIVEEQQGASSSTAAGTWGKLKSGLGWILLAYTKRK